MVQIFNSLRIIKDILLFNLTDILEIKKICKLVNIEKKLKMKFTLKIF